MHHKVSGANIAGQGTQPSSALHMERYMRNASMTITLKSYADPCGGNRMPLAHDVE